MSIKKVDSWELPLSAIPLCQLLQCHLGPPRPTLSSTCMSKAVLTAPLSVPHVHTSGAFSTSEWGPMPSRANVSLDLVVQYLVAWHCRSIWSLPCHFAADVGGLALSVAKSHWHGTLRSTHDSCTPCTPGHMSWKRGGRKRELVAAPWTSSRQFSHVLWLKIHSHWLLRACLLGSKRKLPPPACQVLLALPCILYRPRDVQFPGTVYICNQDPLSGDLAHCISCAPSACSHCRRCIQPYMVKTTEAGAVWSGSTLFAIPLSILRNNYIKAKLLSQKCMKKKIFKF